LALHFDRDNGRLLADTLTHTSRHPVTYVGADLRQVAETKAAVDETARAVGELSVLVNNAAWDDRHDLATVSEAYWDEAQSVNLKQVFCRQWRHRQLLVDRIPAQYG
jgi:NAD(P)-dependent dehydrogenase (short-subunit alcohol dehydrogenase family)